MEAYKRSKSKHQEINWNSQIKRFSKFFEEKDNNKRLDRMTSKFNQVKLKKYVRK